MTIPATVSAGEVASLLRNRYVDQYFEARLINLPAYDYTPGTSGSDATLLAGELPVGTAGYERAIIYWTSSEVGSYADGGVALQQKATTFAHDGGSTAISFSHIALVWSTGSVLTLGAVTDAPTSLTTAAEPYTNVPVDVSSGNGRGMTVDIDVANDGQNGGADYTITVNKPGYGYSAADSLTIVNSTLASLDTNIGNGNLTFSVGTTYEPDAALGAAGDLVAAVKTASTVNLVDGYEAAFYWNLKQFGFYSTAA